MKTSILWKHGGARWQITMKEDTLAMWKRQGFLLLVDYTLLKTQ